MRPFVFALVAFVTTLLRPRLWEANSQYDGIRLCGAVLRALAVVVPFAPCATSSSSPSTLLVTCVKLLRRGGRRAVAAESLMLKHQLLIANRSRQRAPNLTSIDRFLLGLTTLFVSLRRIAKLGTLVKPATLLKFHKALVDRKYRLLFSSSPHRHKPGPKGPAAQLVAAIVAMKRRNPRFGCVRIAQQISHAFGLDIDKDVVRRVLAKHYRPGDSGTDGPSWLTFIGHAKDSLWSVDLFRCESILLKSYWVMVVMDIFTRRIIGFGFAPADVDGVSVCRMFNGATAGQTLPNFACDLERGARHLICSQLQEIVTQEVFNLHQSRGDDVWRGRRGVVIGVFAQVLPVDKRIV